MSPVLKAAPYNFSQSDLALMSSVVGISVGVSLPAGFVYDRFGCTCWCTILNSLVDDGFSFEFLGFLFSSFCFSTRQKTINRKKDNALHWKGTHAKGRAKQC